MCNSGRHLAQRCHLFPDDELLLCLAKTIKGRLERFILFLSFCLLAQQLLFLWITAFATISRRHQPIHLALIVYFLTLVVSIWKSYGWYTIPLYPLLAICAARFLQQSFRELSDDEIDVRRVLRAGEDDRGVREAFEEAVRSKPKCDAPNFSDNNKWMVEIGG